MPDAPKTDFKKRPKTRKMTKKRDNMTKTDKTSKTLQNYLKITKKILSLRVLYRGGQSNSPVCAQGPIFS